MTDYATARLNMVASQVRTNDVTDVGLQSAMANVPRELFVTGPVQSLAYASSAVPIGSGRALMEPRSFAKLVQAASIAPDDVVLIVGAGTGYGAAVLAQMAQTVFALEEDPALSMQASQTLSGLGVDNAVVVTGPLACGYPEQAPYDVIFLEGAAEFIPETLKEQIKDGGCLVAIVAEGPTGKGRIFQRAGNALSARTLFDGAAPLLAQFARPREFTF